MTAPLHRITLPTEDQWQHAAQGDDRRAYPWGNTWDCTRCNNAVRPCTSTVTTPVTRYAGKGDSPFGVVDMAGNVWEWCRTGYENGSDDVNDPANSRVLRGGTWNLNDVTRFRCDHRFSGIPHYRYHYWGFRVARTVS